MQIDPSNNHVQLNIRDPHFFNNPYPYYERLQNEAPQFFWEDYGFWTFVTHQDVDQLFRDRRLGRQITHVATREEVGLPPEREELRPFDDVERYSLLGLEPPDHTRLRNLIQKAFMARQIERLRERIAAFTHQLIDEMEVKGPCDLLPNFATPIPVTVIAELLGVPTSMNEQLLAWSHAMVKMYEFERPAGVEEAAVAAAAEFATFLRDYISFRRRDLTDDLISKLIGVEEEGERLTEDEMISTCILLLNAGHEATVNVIGNGVVALLNHPDELRRWQQNPSMTRTAIEELLRYDTPLHVFNRWVLEDLNYKGRHYKKGTQLSLILGAANRDSAAFPNPHTLDLSRRKNPHVSFGGGIHYCVGAPLARLELQIAIPILLQRLPNLQLRDTPQYTNNYHFHGLESVPIGW